MKLRLVVPGTIGQATGGYRYAAAMLREWRAAGSDVRVSELAGTFPAIDAPARKAARDCLAALGEDETPLIDGLALPAFDGLALPADTVALIHHPLGFETGLAPAAARAALIAEAARLETIRKIVATSQATVGDLIRMGVDARKIAAVDPGTDAVRAPLARRGTPVVLCVATLTPRKDHRTLLRALARIRDLSWRASFVGSTTRDPACAAQVRADMARLKLGARVRLLGECDAASLGAQYRAARVFALASRHEGYGMAFAEALAHRLPVAGVCAGAVPLVVPARAGILVRPGDAAAMAIALRRLLGPTGKRYARNAAALRFPDWAAQAQRLWRLAQ